MGVGEATSGGASYFDVRVVAVVNLSSREPVVEAGAEKTMASAWFAADFEKALLCRLLLCVYYRSHAHIF